MNTEQKITNLLNKEPMTINELAQILAISRNSVHQQVSRLEASGTVKKVEKRAAVQAGKPAYQYRTVGGNEDKYSNAYKPLMAALIEVVSTDISESQRVSLFENTGRHLAQSAGLQPTNEFKTDLQKSVDSVNALGAMAEVECAENGASITCYSCPVGTLVHKEPLTCQLVAAFFSEAVGRKVAVRCQRDETVVCGFEVG